MLKKLIILLSVATLSACSTTYEDIFGGDSPFADRKYPDRNAAEEGIKLETPKPEALMNFKDLRRPIDNASMLGEEVPAVAAVPEPQTILVSEPVSDKDFADAKKKSDELLAKAEMAKNRAGFPQEQKMVEVPMPIVQPPAVEEVSVPAPVQKEIAKPARAEIDPIMAENLRKEAAAVDLAPMINSSAPVAMEVKPLIEQSTIEEKTIEEKAISQPVIVRGEAEKALGQLEQPAPQPVVLGNQPTDLNVPLQDVATTPVVNPSSDLVTPPAFVDYAPPVYNQPKIATIPESRYAARKRELNARMAAGR